MDNKLLDRHGTCKTIKSDIEEVRGIKPSPNILVEDSFVVLTFFILGWVL